MTKITEKDIDDLVAVAEKDAQLKEDLQELDKLAHERRVELKDVIQTAVDWYFSKHPEKKDGL